ncbi:MAG TPA: FtsX-like permease family protein, partial [Draconibacterium sp.]|nr:FtsX-like permease family protein [Draconibacterium sp.]
IEKVCPVESNSSSFPVVLNQKTVYVEGLISTTNNFFEIFSVLPIVSISEKPFKDINSAVITETEAKRLFGDEDPLGKTIEIYSNQSVISAIIPDFKANSSIQGKILRNSENKNFRMSNVGEFVENEMIIYSTSDHYLLLENNQDYLDIEQRLNASLSDYKLSVDSVFLQPQKSIYLDTSVSDHNTHGSIGYIRILSVTGFMILLLSVVNYLNYIISSQIKKHKEIGIKKTIGAKLTHLLIYYTADILLWIIISLVISLAILYLTLPLFNSVFQINLQVKELMDIRFVAFGLVVILFIIISSLLPYLIMLSKFQILNFLNGNFGKTGKSRAGSVLTIFQLAISIILISGLFIVQKQISFVKYRDLGFRDSNLLYINMQYDSNGYESLKNEFLKNPAIEQATLSTGVPGLISFRRLNPNWKYTYYQIDADETFLSTMGMKLVEGRNFIPSDGSRNACILNEAAVSAIETDNIELKDLQVGEVVGVVKNFNFESLHQNIQPVVLRMGTGRNLSLRIATENLPAVMDYINKVWADFYPNEPMQYKFYDTWFDSMYKKEEQMSYASMIFSIVAIIITCLGLLGKVIQDSLTRTKEIGIRKVNGANVSEILALLNKDFIKWVAIAFIIAVPIAWYAMQKWLENFAYKTNLSWWIFALAGVLALGIALLTVSWQSWRAATRNPVEALRYE